MDFSRALDAVKNGKKISREGWNGKGMHIELQRPTQESKMTLPYLFLVYPRRTTTAGITIPGSEQRVPWLASQTDLLAGDWVIHAEAASEISGKQKLYAYRHKKGHLTYLDHEYGSNGLIRREPKSDKIVH